MEQDPAQQMLQQAQAAHAALQRQPLIRPTAQCQFLNPYTAEFEISIDPRVNLAATQELAAVLTPQQRLNFVYTPLLAKTLCSDICQLIEQSLKDNRVTDTKADTAFFKRYRELWEKQLYSPDMPKNAKQVIGTLTQWWREDGTDTILKQLRNAYCNHLGRIKEIQSNTADFLAWILTARDIARASCKYDDTSLAYLRTIPQAKPFHLQRNLDDFAYRLAEFCTRLVKSAFGNDYDPADTPITTGRNALYNRLALYDAPTALAEYWAKEGIRRAGKQCPSDRCKNCELRPCKTLQSTTKQMYK